MIPEEAVEAAAKAMSANWKRMHTNEALGFQRMLAEAALEAAAPHMLAHEQEQARLAHVDAVVNAETADRLQAALYRIELALDHAEAHGNYKLYSADLRAAITGDR